MRALPTTLTLSLTWIAVHTGLFAQCPLPTVHEPAVDAWSDRVVRALVGPDACYASGSAFTNSDCNIFAGRVIEQVYGDNSFRNARGTGGSYMLANEIGAALATNSVSGWSFVGPLMDHDMVVRKTLTDAQTLANRGVPVIAVYMSAGHGHVALIGPGDMKPTGSLGDAPVAASFFQGHAEKNFIGKPLSCAFDRTQIRTVRIYART